MNKSAPLLLVRLLLLLRSFLLMSVCHSFFGYVCLLCAKFAWWHECSDQTEFVQVCALDKDAPEYISFSVVRSHRVYFISAISPVKCDLNPLSLMANISRVKSLLLLFLRKKKRI